MKMPSKKPDKRAVRQERGRPNILGRSIRVSFFLTEDQYSKFTGLKAKARKSLNIALTQSYALREGFMMFMAKLQSDIAKAESGKFHAKQRK